MPLFSGIYNRGAGFGPAVTFLYAAPAINVFVIILALKVLGIEIGITWTLLAILFSFILGILMSLLFREAPQSEKSGAFANADGGTTAGKSLWQQAVLIVSLIVLLDLVSSGYWIASGIIFVLFIIFLWRYFTREEIIRWMRETLTLTRILLPWFLIGVLVSTLIAAIIPGWLVAPYVGGNGLAACFIAGFFGTLMEFCSLSLIPVVKAFSVLGMGPGPSLSLLLTGSAISIPGVMIIRRIMGTKKTLVYTAIVYVLSSLAGYIYGLFAG